LALAQLVAGKHFLLTKHIIKGLFNTAFKEGGEIAYKIDELLEE